MTDKPVTTKATQTLSQFFGGIIDAGRCNSIMKNGKKCRAWIGKNEFGPRHCKRHLKVKK